MASLRSSLRRSAVLLAPTAALAVGASLLAPVQGAGAAGGTSAGAHAAAADEVAAEASSVADGVRISETANGGPGGGFDTFIELHNFGDEPVDVEGWTVFRCFASGNLAGTPQVPPFGAVVLEPGESILLAHELFTGDVEPDGQYFGSNNLANAGFGVLVQDGDGAVVDRFAAHTGNPGSPCADGDEFPDTITFADAEAFHRVSDTGDNATDFEIAPRDPQALGRDLFPSDDVEAGVRVSETANGGPGGSFDTFIELQNQGDEPVNVEGWQVFRCFASGNLASAPQVPAFGDVTLEPGEHILLAHELFTGDVEPDGQYFGNDNLANAGFGVLVQDGDGAVVDRFAAHTGNPGSPCADGDEFPDTITFADAESFQRVSDTGNNATDFEIGTRDPQALGRDLFPPPPEITPICEVMGPGLRSPFAPPTGNDPGEVVTTSGIVYAAHTNDTFNNGFWMQMPDDDQSTCPDDSSRGIFVFLQSQRADTPSMPNLGDEVVVTAPVSEFFDSTQLQANNPAGFDTSVQVVSTGNPLPEPTPIDADLARAQDADQLFYASLHQQRVTLEGQTYVGTNKFGEAFLVPGEIDERIRRTDDRFDQLALDDDFLPDGGVVNVWAFDEIEDAVGPLNFTFGNFKLVVEDVEALDATDNQQNRPEPIQEQPAGSLSVANWNIENIFGDPAIIAAEEGIEVLAPSDLDEDGNPIPQPDDPDTSVITPPLEERQRRRDMVAVAMAEDMGLPAIVGVAEIANETLLSQMVDRINEELDARDLEGSYEAILIPGNDVRFIDVGYLVDTSRVQVDNVVQIDKDAPGTADPGEAAVTGRCAQGPEGKFLHDRVPLRLDVTDRATGESFTTVAVHNKSRFGGTEENQEFEPCRVDQSQSVIDHLDTEGLDENVLVVGDVNTFRDSPTLALYAENGFVNLVDRIPEDRRFSFVFEGRVQFLDHHIASADLAERIDVVDSPKIVNDVPIPQEELDASTGFGSSDHDPIVSYVEAADVTPPAEVEFTRIPDEVLAGVPAVVRFTVSGAQGAVTADVVAPDGAVEELTLVNLLFDRYLTVVPTSVDAPGTYTVRVSDDTGEIGSASFEARPFPGRR